MSLLKILKLERDLVEKERDGREIKKKRLGGERKKDRERKKKGPRRERERGCSYTTCEFV